MRTARRLTLSSRKLPLATCVFISLFLISPWSNSSSADEPVQKFLDALKENGYFDVGMQYLESVDQRGLIGDDFRRILPFEKADILIASVSTVRDAKQKDARLTEAQKILATFNANGAPLEDLARVAQYQGNLSLTRARVTLALGGSDRLTAAEREAYAKQAREMLASARTNYIEARSKIRELIDPKSPNGLKIDPQDPASVEKLKFYQRTYVSIRLSLPMAIELLGDSYTTADPEYAKFLTEAASEYKDHFSDYQRNLQGWFSRLYEARCYQKLSNHKEALIALEDILSKSGGAFADLKRSAYLMACESWNRIEPYPATEVVQRLGPLVEGLSRLDARNPDYLRIQLELAVAQLRMAEELKAQPGAAARNEADTARRSASKLVRLVARTPSPYRDRARELMSQWNISMAESKSNGESETGPQTFEEARQKIKDNVSDIEELLGELRLRKTELASAAEDQKAALQQTVAGLNEQLMDLTNGILGDINLALSMKEEDTLPADINQLRYLQCYCFYSSDRLLEAIIIGEFMLSKFPAMESTRQAMNLVIKCYNRLYSEAKPDDRAFEKQRLSRLCDSVIERWPGSVEASTAAASMIQMAIMDKDLSRADSMFKHLSEDYPGWPLLSAQFGNRAWATYRQKVIATPEQASSFDAERSLAQGYLERAVKLSSSENLVYDIALASRNLVDLYLGKGETDLALQSLENSDVSPLDLVKQKHPAIMNRSTTDLFVRDTYRLALKVYMASMKKEVNPQAAIEKMKGILAAMRQDAEASNRPEDRSQLSQIYSLIASELLNQFEAKPDAEKGQFAASLNGFLNSIERDSKDAETILWAGSTALRVAGSLSHLGFADESKPMFEQAVSALNRAEELGFENNPERRDALLLELKRQRGLALRGNQKFEEALDQFCEILDVAPQNVKVQIDAAETLQLWGIAIKRARLLAESIKGTRKKLNPQTKRESNQVWGWEFLARATRGKNDDLFCTAVFHWAECLLENGIIENNKKTIGTALLLIETEEKRSPSLSVEAWKPRFEKLKERIKKNQ